MVICSAKLALGLLCACASVRIDRKRQPSHSISQDSSSLLDRIHLQNLVVASRSALWGKGNRQQASHPEDGNSQEFHHLLIAWQVLRIAIFWAGILALCILAVFFALFSSMPCWVGPQLKDLIEHLDKAVVGSDIRVESISVNPFLGRVNFKRAKFCNPSGYHSDYMLKVENIYGYVRMRLLLFTALKSLFCRCSVQIVVSCIVFSKCQGMLEKHAFHTSNLKQVLDELAKQETVEVEDHPADSAEVQSSSPQFIIQEMRIKNMDVRFQVEGTIFGKNLETGCDIGVADIVCNDFSRKEVGIHDVGAFVFETLLKIIHRHVDGKIVGNHVF